MKVVLLYKGAHGIGGIETLACRLAKTLVSDGHYVVLLFKNAAPIVEIVPQGVAVLSADNEYDAFINQSRLNNFLNSRDLTDVELVIALDSFSALFAPLIAHLSEAKQCVAVATNWVPRYFDWNENSPLHPYSMLQKFNLKKNYLPHSTLFMLQKYVQQGKAILGPEWDATIFPIPIEWERFAKVKRRPIKGRIVSVGRLDVMKEYNLYMIGVVRTLIDEGREVVWHVHGDGPLRERMQDRIHALDLQDRIILHGAMDYRKYEEVLAEAHVFIGMGTALLEAAAAGVPNVVSFVYDESGITHGPVYQVPNNICELVDDAPTKSVISELRHILDASDEELDVMADESKRTAYLYSESVVKNTLYKAAMSTPPSSCAALPYRLALRSYASLVVAKSALSELWSQLVALKPPVEVGEQKGENIHVSSGSK